MTHMKIPLSRGKVALVSPEDYERVSSLKWGVHASGVPVRFYARRAYWLDGQFFNVLLHRFILEAPEGMQVDHINGNGLDNRRENIRLATPKQNQRNRRKWKTSESGFKGVFKSGRYFKASIVDGGRSFFLGGYETAEAAARAYDAASYLIDPDFSILNFADIDPEAMKVAAHVMNGGLPSDLFRNPIKLTDEDVIEIRLRYAEGGVLYRELAEEYGVTGGAIQHAVKGRTFTHITNPAPIQGDRRERKPRNDRRTRT